ncbi:MAG: aminoacetone oxidase family FAD-binding enzyme [Lachnospiraceae bacterium]|nr:aminoacetone oxidase family FAD-binding enzyme [Lachnospiraceae bacterium]
MKTERGGRVFPVSDKSSDIIRTLTKEMERLGVRVRYGAKVQELVFDEDAREAQAQSKSRRVTGVQLADGSRMTAKAVIIATGGLSYPATGATGDGYGFAESAGHTVTECQPSLVPFETEEQWHRKLQGLSLKNVRLYSLRAGQKKGSPGPRFDEQGELLFTHFGISGPLVLTASARLGDALPLRLAIDLKPALTAEELDYRLLRDFSAQPRRQFKNSLGELFPAKLIPVMCALAEAEIPRDTPAGELTRAQRLAFGALIKALPVTVTGTRGFSEAVITRGGVELKEINPSTMESRLCRGLFFAGEVLDCDALTGGYNLQIAWSTGALAGESAAGCRREN